MPHATRRLGGYPHSPVVSAGFPQIDDDAATRPSILAIVTVFPFLFLLRNLSELSRLATHVTCNGLPPRGQSCPSECRRIDPDP